MSTEVLINPEPPLNFRIGQRVTIPHSTTTLVIEAFSRMNDGPWFAHTRFLSDPRGTTFRFPVGFLRHLTRDFKVISGNPALLARTGS